MAWWLAYEGKSAKFEFHSEIYWRTRRYTYFWLYDHLLVIQWNTDFKRKLAVGSCETCNFLYEQEVCDVFKNSDWWFFDSIGSAWDRKTPQSDNMMLWRDLYAVKLQFQMRTQLGLFLCIQFVVSPGSNMYIIKHEYRKQAKTSLKNDTHYDVLCLPAMYIKSQVCGNNAS